MRLSELVRMAQDIIDRHGDMDVFAEYHNPTSVEFPLLYTVNRISEGPRSTGNPPILMQAKVILDPLL